MTWRTRLRWALWDRTYTLFLGAGLPVPGLLAVLLGDQVSAALGIIVADDVSRIMGVAFLAGGIATVTGLLSGSLASEFTGMTLLGIGFGIYGLGVLLGLGLAGAIAGPIALILSAAIGVRIVALRRRVRRVREDGC
ncbi:MAG: hypothetical protein ACRDRC_01715 [Pseudonocardiaceae bacterium]